MAENANDRDSKWHTDFKIAKPILRSDGGVLFTAEYASTTFTNYYDVFTQTYVNRTNYVYGNVFVISINANGSIDWKQCIRKDQVSTEDDGYFSSFLSLVNKNRINYLYNDYSNNNKVLSSSISSNGEISNSEFFSGLEEVLLIPKSAKQVDARTIIIPAEKSRRFCFLKLQL